MSNLEVFFLLMIVLGLVGIGLVLRHDTKKTSSKHS
jgi:hypothetical protein